jgi:hypothetical protein
MLDGAVVSAETGRIWRAGASGGPPRPHRFSPFGRTTLESYVFTRYPDSYLISISSQEKVFNRGDDEIQWKLPFGGLHASLPFSG